MWHNLSCFTFLCLLIFLPLSEASIDYDWSSHSSEIDDRDSAEYNIDRSQLPADQSGSHNGNWNHGSYNGVNNGNCVGNCLNNHIGNENGNLNNGDENGSHNGNCFGNCVGNLAGNGNGNANNSSRNGNKNGNCVGNCFHNIVGNAIGNMNKKHDQGNNHGNCYGNCFHRNIGNLLDNGDSNDSAADLFSDESDTSELKMAYSHQSKPSTFPRSRQPSASSLLTRSSSSDTSLNRDIITSGGGWNSDQQVSHSHHNLKHTQLSYSIHPVQQSKPPQSIYKHQQHSNTHKISKSDHITDYTTKSSDKYSKPTGRTSSRESYYLEEESTDRSPTPVTRQQSKLSSSNCYGNCFGDQPLHKTSDYSAYYDVMKSPLQCMSSDGFHYYVMPGTHCLEVHRVYNHLQKYGRSIRWSCAPGTAFDLDLCSCIHWYYIDVKDTCRSYWYSWAF